MLFFNFNSLYKSWQHQLSNKKKWYKRFKISFGFMFTSAGTYIKLQLITSLFHKQNAAKSNSAEISPSE